jgi:RimJ/RimL family protein N-acetyltransferase
MLAPTLSTDRLFLRAIRLSDWEAYANMWSDPRVTEFIGGEPRPRDTAWQKFGQGAGFWALFGYGYWTIADQADQFIGVGGFARHERGLAALGDHPECGWTLVPESWGKGIASEAVGAMVAWADSTHRAETRCLISNGNIASIKVAERNGYAHFADVDGNSSVFRRPAPSVAGRVPS